MIPQESDWKHINTFTYTILLTHTTCQNKAVARLWEHAVMVSPKDDPKLTPKSTIRPTNKRKNLVGNDTSTRSLQFSYAHEWLALLLTSEWSRFTDVSFLLYTSVTPYRHIQLEWWLMEKCTNWFNWALISVNPVCLILDTFRKGKCWFFLKSMNMVVHRYDSLTIVTFTFPFTGHNKLISEDVKK
jgi:hypothetical protein